MRIYCCAENEDLNQVFESYVISNSNELVDSDYEVVITDSISKLENLETNIKKVIIMNFEQEDIEREFFVVQITINKEISKEEFITLLTLAMQSENSKNILVS